MQSFEALSGLFNILEHSTTGFIISIDIGKCGVTFITKLL